MNWIGRLVGGVLLAAAVALGASGCAMGCPAALAAGVLVADGDDLAIRSEQGDVNRIVWPSGYRVRREGDTLLLTNLLGQIVARQGDRIEVGGGVDLDGTFRGCGSVVVVLP